MSREYSDLFLERYLAGDLKPEDKNAFEAKLSADPALAERLRVLKASNDEILARYPVEKMAETIRDAWASSDRRERPARQKASNAPYKIQKPKKKAILLWITPALVLGIAAFVLFSPFRVNEDGSTAISRVGGDPETPSGIRFKGEDQLYVYRKKTGSEASEKLEPGQVVRSGDTVQLAYLSAGGPYGVIFSIDGRGNLTRHFPEKAAPTTALISGKKTFLSESYELDDAPRYEIFFFVTGRDKLDTGEIMARAATLAKTPDSSESGSRAAFPKLHVTTFKILKQNP